MAKKSETNEIMGQIVKIAGPVVVAKGMRGVKMYEVVRVGDENLIGEVIELEEDRATIQVYEETTGIGPGAKVRATGASLSVELGPGLISSIYDGILRPLDIIREKSGDFIARGVEASALDHDKKWPFKATVKKGDKVKQGSIIGEVKESSMVVHKVLVPPGMEGEIVSMVKDGDYTVDELIAELKTKEGIEELKLMHKWPVRIPRPTIDKEEPTIPLITGMRILDTFSPVAKGGTAAIPGPFGAGKTVTQQSLARYCDAEIIVYIGCGERGNEMTDVLKTFPHLKDPRSGEPLLNRTIIIANTSNMPVAAREASVYTGITIAEYFRDQGYDVALMADSTSRWAEAMREISGRLEEMPGEEGYPAYLATRLAQFYERAGRVQTLGGNEGSVTVIGAVSPPGGDFSEPVTQNTLRVNKVFWALDKSLASRRHFPAINWLNSYSLYLENVTPWFQKNSGDDWRELRDQAMALLQKEEELQEIVQLVGPDALPDTERVVLEVTKMLREDFLQQNAYHDVDAYCPIEKQRNMLKIILRFNDLGGDALKAGVSIQSIGAMKIKAVIGRMKEHENESFTDYTAKVIKDMEKEFSDLKGDLDEYKKLEYSSIKEIAGPLLVVKGVEGVSYGELVEIMPHKGAKRTGQVLEAKDDLAVVQVFEGTRDLDTGNTTVRFTGETMKIGLSRDMIGRIFNGMGKPIDKLPDVIVEKMVDINGMPINPTSREFPEEFIQTGISTIDVMNTLVRGQKLPIFSEAGLPHNNLAAQIARQAKVIGDKGGNFAVVFAAMGITFEEAKFFMNDFERTGAIKNMVAFMNLADDPAIERIITPRIALSTAEYLAYEHGMHILVILTDLTNYCEALREIAAARNEIPGRRGYPGYMYTDLATLYERAGKIKGKKGSVTQIPILTMPQGDITHPIPDLTGYITEGQIVVNKELHRKAIYPPINPLPSLSRLMNEGIGEGKTREDHSGVSNQMYSGYAEGMDLRDLVAVVGEEALSDRDRKFLKFAEAFEDKLIRQGKEEDRTIAQSLDIGWSLFKMLPKEELKKVKAEHITKFMKSEK